ncbi:uncharacterized protein [Littorina saxatilis]|uniref:C-type lectin domain-containing protein n=1 Tax=Littorina saxatilis TaxID=31220 RepID=A0AAN9G850_9CAEN
MTSRWSRGLGPGAVLCLSAIFNQAVSDSFLYYPLSTACFALSRQKRLRSDVQCPHGQQLATLDSRQQLDELKTAMANNGFYYVHVGVTYDNGSQSYVWSDGQRVDDAMWLLSKPPVNSVSKPCAALFLWLNTRLFAWKCDNTLRYLCRGDLAHGCSDVTPSSPVSSESSTDVQTATSQPIPSVQTSVTTVTSTPPTTVTSQGYPKTTVTSKAYPLTKATPQASPKSTVTYPPITMTSKAYLPTKMTSQASPKTTVTYPQTTVTSKTSQKAVTSGRRCVCRCQVRDALEAASEGDVQQRVSELRSALTVETAGLSSKVRSKTSAPDPRVSSRLTATVAILCVVIAFAVPVIMDLSDVIAFIVASLSAKVDVTQDQTIGASAAKADVMQDRQSERDKLNTSVLAAIRATEN